MEYTAKQLRTLGKTSGEKELKVSPLGLGTWQFAGRVGIPAKYWDLMSDEKMSAIVEQALKGGINWFDTAESYGHGTSERNLSKALQGLGVKNGEVMITSKWWPVLKTASNLASTISDRIDCLAPYAIDLYLVHQPFSFSSVEKQMNVMADLVEQGKIRHVGVSNFSAKAMIKAQDVLQKRGLPLACNQMRYSVLYRKIEGNGILQAAKDRGISIIAWSPLEQGMVSGKFHKDPAEVKRLGIMRKSSAMVSYSKKRLEQTRPVVEAMERIGRRHEASAAQVALNWTVNYHGETILAIPGATSVSQMEQNTGAIDFELSDEEKNEIDELSQQFI